MSVTHVRPIETLESVHTSDEDWKDILRGWMVEEDAPENEIEGYIKKFEKAVEEAGLARPWLLNTPRGIAFVPPQDFVNFYEDVAATDVLGEVHGEMKRADEKGYDAKHDDSHPTTHLLNLALFKITPLADSRNILPDATKREEIIQAAGILVSAVESIDRAQNVRTFGAG